jgi:hypothetical protein
MTLLFNLPPKDLLFARLYYFTFMGGWSFILPFANLFYINLGFSGKQIGFISSTSAIVGMIASPIWVSSVKRHPLAQWILQIAIIFGAIGYIIGATNPWLTRPHPNPLLSAEGTSSPAQA